MMEVSCSRVGEWICRAIQIDEDAVRGVLDEFVGATVEEALDSPLEARANQVCGAKRDERAVDRIKAPDRSCSRDFGASSVY